MFIDMTGKVIKTNNLFTIRFENFDRNDEMQSYKCYVCKI